MTDRINEKLGAWMLGSGCSRSQIAKEIGISRPTLRKRLSGESEWKWEEVARIAEITDTSLNELAGINQ